MCLCVLTFIHFIYIYFTKSALSGHEKADFKDTYLDVDSKIAPEYQLEETGLDAESCRQCSTHILGISCFS